MAQLTFKQSFIHLPSMQLAFTLALRCEQADGYPSKMYWHALNERKNDNNALDYLCFVDENLIGMINVLFFSNSVELTPLVDPQFRRQGIAKKLLNITFAKLRNYVISDYSLICHSKAHSLIQRCQEKNSTHDHDEVEMFAPKIANMNADKKVILHCAELSDIPVLAKLHEQSFEKPSAAQMELRFSITLKESHRRAYLAKNESGDIVGKLHVREDHNRIYLHDIGIAPQYRQQGYGKALMLAWLQQFSEQYDKIIAVEVLGDNIAALRLYESCGFQITNSYQFWKFPFN